MKLYYLAVPYLVLIGAVKGDDDTSIDYPAEYNIPTPTECVLHDGNNYNGYNGGSITNPFEFSCMFHNITMGDPDAYISVRALAYDCVNDYNITLYGGVLDKGYIMFENLGENFNFNATTNIYFGNGFEGNLEFCLRTELVDSNHSVMMFRSQQTNITVSYNGDFVVPNFQTIAYNGISDQVTNDTKIFGVTACICSFPFCYTELNEEVPPLSLGTPLDVCVFPSVGGTIITSLTTFTARKDSFPEYNIMGSGVNNGYTETGLGTEAVMLKAIIPAYFFEDTNDITITGSVEVSPSGTRRQLVISRDLQGQFENSEFALVLSVDNKGSDSPLRLGVDVSSAPGLVVMICTAIFSVATLLI